MSKKQRQVPPPLKPGEVLARPLTHNKAVLSRYIRQHTRALVEGNVAGTSPAVVSDLAPLRVLSDTDLAALFVSVAIKGNTDTTLERYYRHKLKGISWAEMKRAFGAFRIETAPILHRLKRSVGVKKSPGLEVALKTAVYDLRKVAKKLDAFKELQWALQQQRAKLEGLMRNEKTMGWRRDLSGSAMELFTRTAKNIVELEMKLGLRDIVPDEVNVKIHQTVSGHIEHRVEPIGKNKMLEATRQFSRLLDSPVFEAEFEEVPE